MSPTHKNRINVYVRHNQGYLTCVGHRISRDKLLDLSPKAAILLSNGGVRIPGIAGRNNIVMLTPSVDPDAASKICSWIARYDQKKSQESQSLKLEDLNKSDVDHTFTDLVKMYHTAYSFMIPRIYRGDDLRDGIHEYIHMAALSLDEFIMIHECIPFDTGTLKTAQYHCMWLKVMGPPPPQIEAIEQYAREIGFAEDMEKMEEYLRRKKAHDDAREEMRRMAAEEARVRAHWEDNRDMGGSLGKHCDEMIK